MEKSREEGEEKRENQVMGRCKVGMGKERRRAREEMGRRVEGKGR